LGRGTECLFWSIYHVYNSLRVSVSVDVDNFLVELYFSYFFTRNPTLWDEGMVSYVDIVFYRCVAIRFMSFFCSVEVPGS
jgi:hypothetical protein